MREWLIRILLVVTPFGLLEISARRFYHPAPIGDWLFEFDSQKNYRWKANQAGVFGTQPFRTNAAHRVGFDLPLAKPAGTRRFAVVGDSVSFGFNVPYGKSYVPLLEQAIKVPALNFAVPGYSTFQEFYDLREATRYCPDFTILQFSFNDLVEPFLYLRRLGGLGIDYHGVADLSAWHFRLRELSRLYAWVSDAIAHGAIPGYGPNEMRQVLVRQQELNERAFLRDPENARAKAAWQEFYYWLHRAHEACPENCLFLLSPSSVRFYYPEEQQERAIAQLRKRAEAEGFLFVDPWPILIREISRSPERDPVKKWNSLFLDDIHPNERGHAILAKFLAETLHDIMRRQPRVCGEN